MRRFASEDGRAGDTRKTCSLIRLAFRHSLIWARCQVSFSTVDCMLNASPAAVVAGRMEAAQAFTSLSTCTCTVRCVDVTAVQTG